MMDTIFDYVVPAFAWIVSCAAIFGVLALLTPNNPDQKFLRKHLGVDVAYWFLTPIYGYLIAWILTGLALVLAYNSLAAERFLTSGFGIFAHSPIWVQALIVLLTTDMLQYWSHRLFHGKVLWKFHAVHHSSVDVDWLSAVRFHPFNLFIHSVMIGLTVFALGFDPVTYMILGPFTILYNSLVHANLNWTFGPLRYVLASPIYHRWHHTALTEGGEKNFAPTFPFIDCLFGTFYMPMERVPEKFGVSEPVPESFVGQLLYPFKK